MGSDAWASHWVPDSYSQQLEREYDRLLPILQEFSKREAERKKKHVDNRENLGFSQAFELGQKSNQEYMSRLSGEV